MFAKPKNWLGGGIWRPKNPHSLEHLKYLYTILCKYQAVTEQNRALLVESLRSISEILIWGDQNDSSVFDFFLEKNMLSFFLRFMRQKSGKHLCVQLLQTLNILFENISNETSVYYLLSNNHINAIIVHDFNFSDEEVMAYYISFLKTLSFKLNKHTVHFFYNEHTNDFALYTEAIKFFNHSETMVRIAVRTITLNVYKACCFNCKPDTRGQSLVDEKSMLMYIRDKTAAPYFSNLVWFIGNHVLKIDSCVRHDIDHNSRDRLSDIVAEHLDHLHYLNDILCLQIDALNEVLTDNFLNRLLIPLYVYSLTKRKKYASRMDTRPHVSSVVALFLLSQVFLIISHAPLVRQLADIIFNGDVSVCMGEQPKGSPLRGQRHRGFVKPEEPLAETLQSNRGSSYPVRRPNYRNVDEEEHEETAEATAKDFITTEVASKATSDEIESETQSELLSPNQNSTDEEKLLQSAGAATHIPHGDFSLEKRPYLEAIFIALECTENDYETLFSLCILYALGHNQGINQELLDSVLIPTEKSEAKGHYNISLVEKLIQIISLSCQHGSKVRLATLEMSVLMLKTMIYKEGQCFLQDGHLAAVEGSREEATLLLRNFYKSEEIFLDMFEDEYREMQTRPLNVEYLTMDASILLPPTGTPLTGIEFNKRLPCGEVERARRAIRVFFLLRDLSLTLRQEPETQLPLTRQDECVNVDDVLDLNNSDLIACTVISRENRRERRFLVIDVLQMILVEPDSRRLGWGVVRFVGFLQDVEVTGDKDDSRSLHITIHKPFMNVHAHPVPLLSARFIFDDHIRCMAAKQRLSKGRLKARQRKMQMIARMLELPSHIVDSMYQPGGYSGSAASLRTASSQGAIPGRSHPVLQRSRGELGHPGRVQSEIVLNRSVFASVDQSQAFSAARQQHRVQQQGRPQPGRSSSGRSSSRPVAIRQSPGGVMRKRSRQERVLHGQDKVADVEEAEEAQPSPEAHACQNLKQPSTQSDTRHRPTTPEPAPPCQDIPLEDLSNQQSSPQTQHGRSKTVRPKSLRGAKVRSSSNSPRRGRSSSASSCSSGGSLSSSSSDSSRSRSETRVKYPGTEASASCPSHRKASPTSAKNVTSFMKVKTDQGNELSQEKNLDHSSGRKRSCADHSGESCGPKSLTPAQEPAVSLLPENELSSLAIADVVVGSPKLLPPVDPTRIRSVSDTSSSSQSESELCITEDSTSAPGDKPPFQTSPRSDLPLVGENQTVADLSNIERTREESAADQLTKLAQMVTEHYGHQDGQQRQTGRQNLALSSTTGDNIEHEESGKH